MNRVMSRTAEVLGSKNDGVTEDRKPDLVEEDVQEEDEVTGQAQGKVKYLYLHSVNSIYVWNNDLSCLCCLVLLLKFICIMNMCIFKLEGSQCMYILMF